MKAKNESLIYAIEKLADIEHSRWSKWQKYLHEQCVKNDNGSLTIPYELVIKWQKQMTTPYAELTEKEKKSDRDLVIEDLDKLRDIVKLL